jgi:hypothetical protein
MRRYSIIVGPAGYTQLVYDALGTTDVATTQQVVPAPPPTDQILVPPGRISPATMSAATDSFTTPGWRAVPIGGGGFVTGIDVAPDGTTVARTDTYGALLFNRANQRWNQIISPASMPVADQLPFSSIGCYEICIAPSKTTTFYAAWKNSVYKTTDSGKTWTATALTGKTFDPNDGSRWRGRKMAVDPQNDQVVYFGVPTDGVYFTTDGGASWTKDAGIPASGAAGYQFCFDSASTVTSSRQQKLYVGVSGTGVYRTANAGTSWASIAGQTAINRMICCNEGSTSVDSTVLVTIVDANVYRWNASAWSTISVPDTTWSTIACNPNNKSQIVLGSDGAYLAQSSDGGATWIDNGGGGHPTLFNRTRTGGPVPWHGWTNENYMSNGEMAFDPQNSHGPGTLFFAEGIGAWWTNMLTTDSLNKTVAWTGMSAGIEQLVTNQVVKLIGGGLVVAVADRATFVIDPSMTVYPSVHGPDASVAIRHTFATSVSNDGYIYSLNTTTSARSTDKGATWAAITIPTGYPGGNGSIAVDPQNHQNVVAIYPNSVPYYSTDGASTWTAGTGATGPNVGFWDKKVYLCADPVTSGTFYLYADAGLYKSTNSGATWALSFTKGASGPTADIFTYAVQGTVACPPGSGDVWMSGGQFGGWPDSLTPASQAPFIKFTSAGTVANVISNVLEVYKFGFGKAKTTGGYPALFIVGWVNSVYGAWRSDDADQATPTWSFLGTWPNDSFDSVTSVAGDPDLYGRMYVGFNGSGAAVYG